MKSFLCATAVLTALAIVFPTAAADETGSGGAEDASASLSPREVTILRRQMREREATAEAAFRNAETAFMVGEYDKAIEEFLMVSREYEDTSYRMRSVLRVGDVFYRQNQYDRAISYYQRAMQVPAELWWPEEVAEDYARADYMIGVCYYDQRSFNRAFAHFRRFVQRHPNSRFVDRAYDFIGRGNMEMERYGQAIEAFRMVGTATAGQEAQRTITPGEELYVRVVDADVGLATRHATIPVTLTTSSGDEERLDLRSLGLGSSTFIATIRTRLGPPRLTRALEETFTGELQRRLEQRMANAETMSREAKALEEKLRGLRAPVKPMDETDQPAMDIYRRALERQEGERTRLQTQIQTLQQGAQGLRAQAFREVDEAYARVEAILADWDVVEDDDADEAVAADDEATADAAQPDPTSARLSDTFTREQIEEARAEVRQRPTSEANFTYRKAVLSYWHEQLLIEYKTLDVKGGDTITVNYLDAYGAEEENVMRTDTIGIASDAAIIAVGPDLQSSVRAVIHGDVVRIKVVDPDRSVSDGLDTLEVVVAAIPKAAESERLLEDEPEAAEEVLEAADEQVSSVDIFGVGDQPEEDMPELLPEGAVHFLLTCVETGPHTGEFIGTFSTLPQAGAPEAVLELSPEKLVRAAYRDVRTASYAGEWVVATELEIIPASDGMHEVIEMQESQLDRRSELEKGMAMAKLGQVYQELGLRAEASRVFAESIRIVRRIVELEGDSPLGEEATYQLWEVYFASGDEEAAAEACARLIAAFPDSPLAPNALLIMARTERQDWRRAQGHLQRLVGRYGDSSLAPEAHYMMADLRRQNDAFDVAAFEAVVRRYPDSNYAAMSLLSLGEYYIENRDYSRARDYLERITLDFPDFDRLDRVSYMRGICAYRMGDIQLAYTLMHETIERYPGTAAAQNAGRIVTVLAERLKR